MRREHALHAIDQQAIGVLRRSRNNVGKGERYPLQEPIHKSSRIGELYFGGVDIIIR